MVTRVAVVLLAVSLLGLPWLGTATYGQTSQAQKEVSSQQGTQSRESRIVDLLVQKGIFTERDKALLQQGKIPPAPVREGRGIAPWLSPEQLQEYLSSSE